MGAKSLYGPLNSFHMLSLCEYPGIEVSLSARQTEGEGVEDVHVGRHTRILNGRPRGSGLPGFMARLSYIFAGVCGQACIPAVALSITIAGVSSTESPLPSPPPY